MSGLEKGNPVSQTEARGFGTRDEAQLLCLFARASRSDPTDVTLINPEIDRVCQSLHRLL